MRQRLIVHVNGPPGAGKTRFIETMLEADLGLSICVRGVQEAKRRKVLETIEENDEELRRYAEAGAVAIVRFRFGRPDGNAFFGSRVMQDFSEVVMIEGDCPIEWGADLEVFVAPVPTGKQRLLTKTTKKRPGSRQAQAEIEEALETREGFARMMTDPIGIPVDRIQDPKKVDAIREWVKRELARQKQPRTTGSKHNAAARWTLNEAYAGIERANVVIVNIRDESERPATESLLEDIARLRQDEAVFQDILGPTGKRTRITALAADLSNQKDPGTKKAHTRLRRAVRSALE